MKKLYTLFIIAILFAASFKANAQGGFGDLIKSSPENAARLLNAYGEPLFKGFGAGMNSGWANTAKTNKLLHFELRITASAAFTPVAGKTFDVTKIGLTDNVRPEPGQPSITPTITGERNNDGTTMGVYNNGHEVSSFTMPSGKLPVVPAPQVQLTIGLIKSTDLTIRAIPKISFGDNVGSVSMIGFGIKHDLMQYFGPAKKVVPFNLSVLFAYSRLNLDAALDVKPQDGTVHDPGDPNNNTDFSNQHTNGHFDSFLAEALISKKLLFFTPFLAVGYNHASTSLAALGNYPVTTGDGTYTIYTDPIHIKESTISGMRADVGFQLNLGIRIFASASLAQYKSVNAGIGFGF